MPTRTGCRPGGPARACRPGGQAIARSCSCNETTRRKLAQEEAGPSASPAGVKWWLHRGRCWEGSAGVAARTTSPRAGCRPVISADGSRACPGRGTGTHPFAADEQGVVAGKHRDLFPGTKPPQDAGEAGSAACENEHAAESPVVTMRQPDAGCHKKACHNCRRRNMCCTPAFPPPGRLVSN